MQELYFTIIVAQKKENFTDYRRLSSYAINPVWYSVSRGLFCTLVVYTVGLYYARTKMKFVTYGFYRAMLCIRGTSHGPVSVCVCVCVCLSQVRVLL